MRSVAHPERDHCHIRYSMRIRDVGRSARHPSSERSECRISDARSFVHTWYCLLGLSVVLALAPAPWTCPGGRGKGQSVTALAQIPSPACHTPGLRSRTFFRSSRVWSVLSTCLDRLKNRR